MKQSITVTYCDRCNPEQKRNRGHCGYFVSDSDIHQKLLRKTGWRVKKKRDICPQCKEKKGGSP